MKSDDDSRTLAEIEGDYISTGSELSELEIDVIRKRTELLQCAADYNDMIDRLEALRTEHSYLARVITETRTDINNTYRQKLAETKESDIDKDLYLVPRDVKGKVNN